MAKYGVREVANVVFKALAKMQLGKRTFLKNEPVLYFDTLTATSIEGASTTSYANGGRGNSRLMSWDGDKTVTFNMTDALISAEGLAILSGAELFEAGQDGKVINQHMNEIVKVEEGIAKVTVPAGKTVAKQDVYLMVLNDNREIVGEPCKVAAADVPENGEIALPECLKEALADVAGDVFVMVDYYIAHTNGAMEMVITPEAFGGNFYIEGDTLFRRETDGKDVVAQFVIPNGKVQSNFTISMSGTGDPSTFDFVVDAFPGFVVGGTEKVLAAIQVFDEAGVSAENAVTYDRQGCCVIEVEAEEVKDAATARAALAENCDCSK